jgi:hypothetical protein
MVTIIVGKRCQLAKAGTQIRRLCSSNCLRSGVELAFRTRTRRAAAWPRPNLAASLRFAGTEHGRPSYSFSGTSYAPNPIRCSAAYTPRTTA